MSLRINQNVAALNAYRNLSASNTALGKSLEKLSSGFRINRAADDAAGLVKSENLRAEIRGSKQAVRNAQDGVSMIQTAEVVGVRGFVTPPKRKDDKPEREKAKRRAFVAEAIRVEDVDLEVTPREGEPYGFAITKAEVAPFRSRSALFDLLFRSNMRAEVAGQRLAVETREITEFGRETLWHFNEIEAEKLRLLVPKAPLTWLRGGTVDARVDDRWSLSDDWIEMDWRLTFRDVAVEVPPDAGLREKTLAAGFGKIVAAKRGNADFHYRLRLDQQQIAVARGGDLSGFWDIVAGQLIGGAETDESKAVAEEADSKVKGALDRMKGLLRRDPTEE